MALENSTVFREQGGGKLVVASGGELEMQSGSTLDIQAGTTVTIAPSVVLSGDLDLQDNDKVLFGTGDDVTMYYDGSDLYLTPIAADGFLIGSDSYNLDITLKGTLTIGKNDTGHDVKLFGATTGAYMLWDESEDELVISKGRMSFAGAVPTDHVLDFSGVTMPASKNLIRGGAYGSPLAYSAASGGLLQLYASQAANSGVDVITFFYLTGTGSAGLIGDSALVEGNSTGANYPKTLEGGQFMAGLKTGAKLAALGGDATAGMYGAWLKVYSAVDSVCDSGCRVAALWVDNQMSCTVSGEEYTIFGTTGGSKPDAFIGLETSSSGWSQFLYLDETMAAAEPFVANGCNVSGAGASEPYLKVLVNATQYGIPLIAI